MCESVPTRVSGIGDPAAAVRRRIGDYRREELQVHLVDDARPWRDDPQVAKRRLRPAQQLVALTVPLVLALDVEGERSRRPEPVDLDGVIDHQVRRNERVDLRRVAAEVGHRVAHDREVDDRGHAREVLEHDSRGHERDVGLGHDTGSPRREGLDVLLPDDATTRVAENVLEENLERHRGPLEVDPVADRRQPEDVGQACAKARP